MNKHLTAVFTAIIDNEIVIHETNLLAFHKIVKKKEDAAHNYQWFYRHFLASDRFQLTLSGKTYHFQKLV